MKLNSEQIILQRANSFLYSFLTKIFLSIIFIFLISLNKSFGQTPTTKLDGFSINPKIGLYKTTSDKEGFAGGLELNFFKNKFLFSTDYYRFEEFVLFESPSEYFNQIGLMAGKYNENGIFRLQYQVGLGLIWGLKRTTIILENPPGLFNTQYESKDFIAVGFIPKLGFKFIPFSFLSIGIDLQANINLKNTVFTPLISLEIGDLRN